MTELVLTLWLLLSVAFALWLRHHDRGRQAAELIDRCDVQMCHPCALASDAMPTSARTAVPS